MSNRDRSQMPAPWPISAARDDRYPNKKWAEVNPENEPVGPFTGRCQRCGSDDLWDDCTAYGCNNCGAIYSQ